MSLYKYLEFKEKKKIQLQNKFNTLEKYYDDFYMSFYDFKEIFDAKNQKKLLNSIYNFRKKLSLFNSEIKKLYLK